MKDMNSSCTGELDRNIDNYMQKTVDTLLAFGKHHQKYTFSHATMFTAKKGFIIVLNELTAEGVQAWGNIKLGNMQKKLKDVYMVF